MEVLDSFRQQYGALYEASVGALHYQFSTIAQEPYMELVVKAYPLTLPRAFHTVKLRFTEVKSFLLQEKPGAVHVDMLYGISYLFKDGHYHFDFTYDGMTSAEVMQENSEFYVMCRGFSYEVVSANN